MVLSDQELYGAKFDPKEDQNQWINSPLRTALNSRTVTTFNGDGSVQTWGSFGGDVFTTAEYSTILETTHKQQGSSDGKDTVTTEKVYLLGYDEVQNSDYGFSDDNKRKTSPTLLGLKAKMYGNKSLIGHEDGACWWLRSPNKHKYLIFFVNYEVWRVYLSGALQTTSNINNNGVRPAFDMNQGSVLFATAAQGGKTSVKVGDGVALPNYTGREYKLTLLDTNIETPAVSVTQRKWRGVESLVEDAGYGGTIDLTQPVKFGYADVTVNYTSTAIQEGKADYVSAIVADRLVDYNYVNYGKISSAASGKDKSLLLTNLSKGTYSLYLFAERIGTDEAGKTADSRGIEYTDYASALVNMGKIQVDGTIKNKDTLSNSYKSSKLAIILGNSFNLSFENGGYDTKITTDTTGATIKSGADGTTISGGMTVNGALETI